MNGHDAGGTEAGLTPRQPTEAEIVRLMDRVFRGPGEAPPVLTDVRDVADGLLDSDVEELLTCTGVAEFREKLREFVAGWVIPDTPAHEELSQTTGDLATALRDVMEWIGNWDPSYTADAEWPASRDAARAALARFDRIAV